MSENRETPAVGAPVEETEPSRTDVLEAVGRATGSTTDADPIEDNGNAAGTTNATPVDSSDGAATTAEAGTDAVSASGVTASAIAEEQRREALSEVDTEMNIEVPAPTKKPKKILIAEPEELPSAAEEPAEAASLPSLDDTPVRDGEIRISEDHPMAALYTQTPAPPEIRGNRGAGMLIALVATVGFALVYAGVIAAWNAPHFPPSTFLEKGLLPYVLSVTFGVTVFGFFCALTLLVMIVGRAGWWAYAIGGFLVAVGVWLAAILGAALDARFVGGKAVTWDLFSLVQQFGVALPAIVAGIVARETSIWFGAWIGSRGRRMKLRNAEALAEYETARAEVQAKPL